jgi:hypothetical protein
MAKEPNTSISHRVLSWPFDSERLNSTVAAYVFELVGTLLLDNFFPYDDLDNQLLRRLGDVDHRKYFIIQSRTFKENDYISGSNFGFDCVIKKVQGTILCSTAHRDMLSFDADKFRKVSSVSRCLKDMLKLVLQGISRLEATQVIQRYQPSSTSLELPLFRCDPDGHALSGLYIKGQGQMSTFWYWFLDAKMRYYRDFETVNLVGGERIFRDEDFELWPDRNESGDEEEEEEDRR